VRIYHEGTGSGGLRRVRAKEMRGERGRKLGRKLGFGVGEMLLY
jgi:hypothetical protein